MATAFSVMPQMLKPKAPSAQHPGQRQQARKSAPQKDETIFETLGDFIAIQHTEQEQKEKLFKKLEQQKNVVEAQRSMLETIRTERVKMKEEQKMLESKIVSLNLQAIENKDQYKKLQQIVNQAQVQLEDSEKKSVQLALWRTEIEDRLKNATNGVSGKIDKHNEARRAHKEREARLEADLKGKEQELAELLKKHGEISGGKQLVEADLAKAKTLCADKDTKIEQLKVQYAKSLREENEKSSSTKREWESKYREAEELKKHLQKADELSVGLKKQLDDTSGKLTQKEGQLADTKDKSRRDLETLKRDKDEADKKLAEAAEKIDQTRREAGETRKELATAKASLSGSQEALQMERAARAAEEKKSNKLELDNGQLQANLRRCEEEHKKFSMTLGRLEVVLSKCSSSWQATEGGLRKQLNQLHDQSAAKAAKIEEGAAKLAQREEQWLRDLGELQEKVKANEGAAKKAKLEAEAEAKKKHDKDVEKNLQAAQKQLDGVHAQHHKDREAQQKELDEARRLLAGSNADKQTIAEELARAMGWKGKAEKAEEELKAVKKEHTAAKRENQKAIKSVKDAEEEAANYRRGAEAALKAAKDERDAAAREHEGELAALRASLEQEKAARAALERSSQEEAARQQLAREGGACIERAPHGGGGEPPAPRRSQEVLVQATQQEPPAGGRHAERVPPAKAPPRPRAEGASQGSQGSQGRRGGEQAPAAPPKPTGARALKPPSAPQKTLKLKVKEGRGAPPAKLGAKGLSKGTKQVYNKGGAALALSLSQTIADDNNSTDDDERPNPAPPAPLKRKLPSLPMPARKKYGPASRGLTQPVPAYSNGPRASQSEGRAPKGSPAKSSQSSDSAASVQESNIFADM